MLCRTAAVASLALLADGWRPVATDHVDHASLPVRCHWADAADAGLCEIVLETVAVAWTAQVEVLGFAAPMPDDDGILDVYLTTEGTEGGAYVSGPSVDEDPDDGRMGCHGYMALDPSISRDDMPAYVAHEFNHLTQFATDFAEPTLPVWEATATAAEAWTLPDTRIAASYVRDFQRWPWMGILGDGYILWDDHGIWSYHEYGAGLWILHMDAVHGDGAGAVGPALWAALAQEGWTNEPDVLDAWATVAGMPWEEALLAFTAFRHLPGTDAAPAWTEAAGDDRWAIVPSARVGADQRAAGHTLAPEPGVYPTGSYHFTLEAVDAAAPAQLRVTGGEGIRWALLLTDAAGQVEDGDPAGHETALEGTLTVAVVNLGPAGFDADDRLVPTVPRIEVGDAILDTASDDGGGGGDGNDGDDGIPDRPDDTGAAAPAADTPPGDKDGGCAVLGAPAGGALALWALGLGLGRRRD